MVYMYINVNIYCSLKKNIQLKKINSLLTEKAKNSIWKMYAVTDATVCITAAQIE